MEIHWVVMQMKVNCPVYLINTIKCWNRSGNNAESSSLYYFNLFKVYSFINFFAHRKQKFLKLHSTMSILKIFYPRWFHQSSFLASFRNQEGNLLPSRYDRQQLVNETLETEKRCFDNVKYSLSRTLLHLDYADKVFSCLEFIEQKMCSSLHNLITVSLPFILALRVKISFSLLHHQQNFHLCKNYKLFNNFFNKFCFCFLIKSSFKPKIICMSISSCYDT